jgi:hypothetical protein
MPVATILTAAMTAGASQASLGMDTTAQILTSAAKIVVSVMSLPSAVIRWGTSLVHVPTGTLGTEFTPAKVGIRIMAESFLYVS